MATHTSMAQLGARLVNLARDVEEGGKRRTNRAILAGVAEVARGTPVDTGRARYNWLGRNGQPTTAAELPIVEYPSASAAENLAAGKKSENAVLQLVVGQNSRELDRRGANGDYYVTNNVGYVADLNRGGRSPQAPEGGFVEVGLALTRETFDRGVTLRG